MQEDLDSRTAKEFIANVTKTTARGAGYVGAFIYAIPTGTILWLLRQDTGYSYSNPSLLEEIKGMYRIIKPLAPSTHLKHANQVPPPKPPARILKFYGPKDN